MSVISHNLASQLIKVLYVDDSEELLQLYGMLLDSEPDITCVGKLSSTEHLLEQAHKLNPDVLLMDLTMPGANPLLIIPQLRESIRVLLFSGHDQQRWKDAAFECGAWGLVSKHGKPDDVIRAIREVAAGQAVFR